MTDNIDKPSAQWELITPEVAEELLKHNVNNRNPRHLRIDKYARIMDLGDWAMTGQPIIIGSDGTVMDGQHRLMAVIQTGRSVWLLVVRGVDPSLMPMIDRGAPRSGTDAFKWAGYPHAAISVAAIRQVLVLSHGKSGKDRKSYSVIADHELVDAYPLYENVIAWAAPLANQVNRALRVAPAKYLAAVLWLSVNNCNPESIQEFSRQLISGADLHEGSPILALRSWAVNASVSKKRLRNDEVLIAVVKAWNDVAEGRTRIAMSVKPSELLPTVVAR